MSFRRSEMREVLMGLAIAAVLIVGGVFVAVVALADENDGAVGLSVEVVARGATFGPVGYTHTIQIPASRDTIENAVKVDVDRAAYRWVNWNSGDTVGCIFSGQLNGDGSIREAGGGRHCHAAVDQHNCGYFTPGVVIFAVANSCTDAGVSECSGWCW